MAVRAANPLAPFWYEPKDREEGEKVRFRLRGLTAIELFDVNAESSSDGKTVKFSGAALRTALSAGLLGWEDFLDADGNPVEFSTKTAVERLPFTLATELFQAIVEASSLTGEKAKN